MDDLTYVDYLVNNIDIWQQAIFIGVVMMGSACLMGLLISASTRMFKMISR